METGSEATQLVLAHKAERDEEFHGEVVIGFMLFGICGAVMGVVGTLLVEGITWHWFFLP